MKSIIMETKIRELVNDNISGEDMMDYVDMDLQEIIQNIANEIDISKVVIVNEISDGKYRVSLMDTKSTVDINGWESKEQFADDMIELFL